MVNIRTSFWSKISNLFTTTAIIVLISCTSGNAVHDLTELRDDIRQNHSQYSYEDWEDVSEHFFELCERLNEMEFTKEEWCKINHMKGEIVGWFSTDATQAIADLGTQVNEEISAFSDGFEQSFESPK